MGLCYTDDEVIGIFNEAFTIGANKWHLSHPLSPTITGEQLREIKQKILLHEIGHALGLGHVTITSGMYDIMMDRHASTGALVEIGDWLYYNNPQFSIEELREILSCTCPFN